MSKFVPEGGFYPPIEEITLREKNTIDQEYANAVNKRSRKTKIMASFGLFLAPLMIYMGVKKYPSAMEKERVEVEAKEKNNVDDYEEYLKKLQTVFGELNLQTENADLLENDAVIAKYEAISDYFMNNPENLEELNKMIDLAVSGDPKIAGSKIYKELAQVEAQDLFYERLRKNNKYNEVIAPQGKMEMSTIFGILREHHFETLAKGFLPRGSEITDAEIDPRLFQKDVEGVKESIETYPEWSDEAKKKEFKYVLDREDVRKILETEEYSLNLSQVYSLIKIAIDLKKEDSSRSYAEIIKDLAEKQEVLQDQEFMGKSVDNFIFVAGRSKRLNDDISRFAPSYEKYAKQMGIKNIKGFAAEKDIEKEFKDAVENSKDNTIIFVDAHSSESAFMLNNKEVITVEELVKSLLTREKKGEKLSGVTIVLGGCDSYELAKNLYGEFKKQVKAKKYKDMELPNIITAVTGRAAIEQNAFRNAFFEVVDEAVKTDKAISFGDILGKLQPKSYKNGGDLSVFVGNVGQFERVAETVGFKEDRVV